MTTAPEGQSGGQGSPEGGEGNKTVINPSHDEATPEDKGIKPAPEAPQRPEWLPENFWNTDKGEANYEELGKAFTETKKKLSMRTDDLEKKIKEDFEKGRFANRPESADKYELRAPQQYADAWEWNENDPLIGFARELAFNSGYGQDEFDKMVGAYVESEIAKLPDIEAETKRLGEKGKERLQRIDNWMQANISPAAYAALSSVTTKAEVIVAIEELMQKAGAPAFVVDSDMSGTQEVMSDALVKTWMADPRYWDPQRREQKWVDKVDNAWRKLYPAKK